jgi:hypothetical protein
MGAAFEGSSFFFFFNAIFGDGALTGTSSDGTSSLTPAVTDFLELVFAFFEGGGSTTPSSLHKQIRLHQQHR